MTGFPDLCDFQKDRSYSEPIQETHLPEVHSFKGQVLSELSRGEVPFLLLGEAPNGLHRENADLPAANPCVGIPNEPRLVDENMIHGQLDRALLL